MKPYGAKSGRPKHITNVNGWYIVSVYACGCCAGKYWKKKYAKGMKASERRKNKVTYYEI